MGGKSSAKAEGKRGLWGSGCEQGHLVLFAHLLLGERGPHPTTTPPFPELRQGETPQTHKIGTVLAFSCTPAENGV